MSNSGMLNPLDGILGEGDVANSSDESEDDSSLTKRYFSISNFPDEILLIIFSNFNVKFLCSTIALVCCRWNALVDDPSLWKNLRFGNWSIKDEDVMMKLIRRAPCGISVYIESALVTNRLLDTIQLYLPLIQNLTLTSCNIYDEGAFEVIASRCQHLTLLNLEGSKFSDAEPLSALANMVHLKHLNASHCPIIIDNNVITAIGENCKQLEYLNIDGITAIYTYSIASFIQCRALTLRYLILDGETLTDNFYTLLDKCRNLKDLRVSFCEEMTDRSLLKIAKLSKLQTLKLRKGQRLTAKGLSYIFTDKKLSHLTYLNLSECPLIDDMTLKSIALNCPLLQNLSLQWCFEITDFGVQCVTEKCEELRHLDLIGVVRLTGSFLRLMEEKLLGLRVLDLEQCGRVDDKLLRELIKKRPALRIFDYWGDVVKYVPCG